VSRNLAGGSGVTLVAAPNKEDQMTIRGRLCVAIAVAALACGALAAVPATAAPAASITSCTGRQLGVHLGSSEGAAGTTYQKVRFRNVGSSACTLDGYPRFVYLNAAGDRIGFPAKPVGAHSPVTIRRDRVAVAALGIPAYQNFPRARCHPRHAAAIRVTAPGTVKHHTLPLSMTVCTTKFGRSTSLAVRHHF
jgi:Domain of unknown function (DUF4232)